VDYEGNSFRARSRDNETALAGSQNMEVQQNIEKSLENKAEQMLTGILGPSKAYVKIAADLDFDRVEKTMEQYNPESKVVRSEERVDETVKNAPDGDNQKERSLTNYEIDKTVQHIIQETGNIKRLTISVAVDGKYAKDKKGVLQNMPPGRRKRSRCIEDMIKNAVGYDLARGDQISVSQVQFDNEFLRQEQQEFQTHEKWDFWLSIAKYAVGLLIVVLLLFFLRYLAKTVVEAMNPPVPALEELGVVEEVPEDLPEDLLRSSSILDRVELMTREEPNNISAIIRQWLTEPVTHNKKKKSKAGK
jgi:flagellar M-ring protein FliF